MVARTINKLSARSVATVSEPGRYSDGGNLYLSVGKQGQRRWVFMYRRDGRRIEMGLGSAGPAGLSLAEARKAASDARALLAKGQDPLNESRASKRAAKMAAGDVGVPTFGDFADEYVATHETAWRNLKHRQQWRTTLTVDAASIRDMPIDAVDTEAVLSVLKPIWSTKNETASRLRGRIEAVLDAAKAKGLRDGENPARWRGHLKTLLPKRQKLSRGHHAALPFYQVPAFMKELRQQTSIASKALEFTILTAARSGEVLGARWDEFDEGREVWTVPAPRMKAGREHRVPLTGRSEAILREMENHRQDDNTFVFPGQKRGSGLSVMSMAMVLRRMERRDITVHGFRSAFRDWAGETTSFPNDICEMALAHTNRDKVEAAYRRGDAFNKRRELMEAWASFVESDDISDTVVRLRA